MTTPKTQTTDLQEREVKISTKVPSIKGIN